jgi:hypothetical protein
MTWTALLTYTATALTTEDTAALSAALGNCDVTYDTDTGRLQITLELTAHTLAEATERALTDASDATGLLKPTRLLVQTTADFLTETAHPAPMTLDLIGITEIAGELGVSRQRAGQLADSPDFPAPVVHPASGRLYTRDSVKAFAARNPRTGSRAQIITK